ncbi:MAG: response regulator transcription factor [Aquabacterium sp.]|jgi:two-component system phosphate regulon response regulator OmpR|nr:MAG: response regulator transcription factor [Aquabacterium sp.]
MLRCLILDPAPVLGRCLGKPLQGLGLDVCVAPMLHDADDSARYDLVIAVVHQAVREELLVCEAVRRAWDAMVVVLLDQRSAVNRVLALEFGADAVVEPPYEERELAARVRSLLRRRHPRALPATPQPGRPGHWEFDRRQRAIVLPDHAAVRLSDTEALVMDALASRAGHVLSRAELLACTGLARQGRQLNVVDLAISRLRGKLERAGADARPLRTVRGLGYAFEPPGRAGPDSPRA